MASRRRAIWLAAFCTVCLGGADLLQADEPIVGAWKMRLSFSRRASRNYIVRFERVDGELRGQIFYRNSGAPLENVALKDGKVAFDVSRRWQGREINTHYEGALSEGAMEGAAYFELRDRTRTFSWKARPTTQEEVSTELKPPPVAADLELNESNYREWRDHILPHPDETAWEEIGWLTTFKDGVLASDAEQKPLLLWTMNGHPLGCT